jgi:flagellar hook-associated protein 3 FlgL
MRVTQSMLANNSLSHISNSYSKLAKLQDQLSTGKRISRPSDDPVVAVKGMFYRSNLSQVEQYQRNISEAYTWLENSEAGIDQSNDVLQRVRELVLQGKNGTNSESDLQANAAEISQLKEDLVGVANTQVAGSYIFNGTKTDTPPITMNQDGSLSLNLETSNYNIEVSQGVNLKVNTNPENLFSSELFSTLDSIIESLNSGNMENSDELLEELGGHIEALSTERSDLGARYNRLELVESRILDQEIIATSLLSDNEDADLERVIIDMTAQESVHRAALSVSASIIQPSLIDFLK